MSQPEPVPAVSFVDEDLDPDDAVARRAERRHATREQWLPRGGGAAISGLVFVLIAWIGAQPVIQAVSMLFPEGDRTYTPPDGSVYGGGGYFGIAPNLIPIISFGTRAAIVLVALLLGLRARLSERSALSGACITTASVSLLLFAGATVAMLVGIAHGHQSNFYGVF